MRNPRQRLAGVQVLPHVRSSVLYRTAGYVPYDLGDPSKLYVRFPSTTAGAVLVIEHWTFQALGNGPQRWRELDRAIRRELDRGDMVAVSRLVIDLGRYLQYRANGRRRVGQVWRWPKPEAVRAQVSNAFGILRMMRGAAKR